MNLTSKGNIDLALEGVKVGWNGRRKKLLVKTKNISRK